MYEVIVIRDGYCSQDGPGWYFLKLFCMILSDKEKVLYSSTGQRLRLASVIIVICKL